MGFVGTGPSRLANIAPVGASLLADYVLLLRGLELGAGCDEGDSKRLLQGSDHLTLTGRNRIALAEARRDRSAYRELNAGSGLTRCSERTLHRPRLAMNAATESPMQGRLTFCVQTTRVIECPLSALCSEGPRQ